MRKWALSASSFLAGLLFALGLGIAGMTQPQKIIGFLDVTGQWDPSLLSVMGGALLVHLITYRLIIQRKSPLFDSCFHIPQKRNLEIKLLGGSALFGIGWGLSGFCPGPAIVALAGFQSETLTFVGSMILGMIIAKWATKKTALDQ